MLGWLGIKFEAITFDFDENSIRSDNPISLTRLLAEAKAEFLMKNFSGIIIGADAVVSFNSRIIEKPRNIKHQRELLYMQRGKPATVISSVCLIDTSTNVKITQTKKTELVMADLTDQQIETYILTKRGLDKAGGYGLQDENGMFIKELKGCYSNSIGFPLCLVSKMLTKVDIAVPIDAKKIVFYKVGRRC